MIFLRIGRRSFLRLGAGAAGALLSGAAALDTGGAAVPKHIIEAQTAILDSGALGQLEMARAWWSAKHSTKRSLDAAAVRAVRLATALLGERGPKPERACRAEEGEGCASAAFLFRYETGIPLIVEAAVGPGPESEGLEIRGAGGRLFVTSRRAVFEPANPAEPLRVFV